MFHRNLNVKSQIISKKEKRDRYYVNKAILYRKIAMYQARSFLLCVSLFLKNGLHLIRPVENKKINNTVLSSLINKDI